MVTKKLSIPIIGPTRMGCDDCAARFERSVRELAGIQSVETSQRTVTLTFDPDRLSLEDIENRAHEIGVELQEKYGHRIFSIDGMDCTDCARKIEGGVTRILGVNSANVNFAASLLSVEYEVGATNVEQIVKVVRRLGYRISDEPKAPDTEPPMPQTPLRNTRVLLTSGSGLLLLFGLGAEFVFDISPFATGLYVLSGLLVGGYVARGAWSALLSRTIETDFLMGLAALGAGYLGDFREMAAVLFLYTLGETLESFTVARARGAIRDLVQSFPKQVTLIQNGFPQLVPTSQVQVGDLVLIRPGDKTAVDGVVRVGSSEVDESLVTGESLPRAKTVGDEVFAGSLNGSGALEVECTRPTSDNTVNRIIHMVEEAQGRKAPTQRLSERFGAIYTPIVIALAIILAAAGPLVLHQTFAESFRRALILLTVSCPCALVLAAPVTIVSALAAAAKNGVLIKGGSVLEALGSVRTVCFDKTGTLTQGRLQVTDVLCADGTSPNEIVRLVASLESRSEHIIGQAVVRHADGEGMALEVIDDFQAEPGLGASGMVNGSRLVVGSARFLETRGVNTAVYEEKANALSLEGKIILLVGLDGTPLGLIALQDEARPEASAVIGELQKSGISDIALVTGDRDEAAQQIAAVAGIGSVHSRMLPEDKLEFVSKQSMNAGGAAMVGDGINDAPALARATVGIAIGSATDASAETAEVLLMTNDLTRLPYSFALARKAVQTIRFNLAFSVAVVLSLIALTITGHLSLSLGVLGHEGSSMIVVASGMRLLGMKPDLSDHPKRQESAH